MYQIKFKETIAVPKDILWEVITNTEDYPKWNTFIVNCKSTFNQGDLIIMNVKLFPFLTIRQKETIRDVIYEKYINYGIKWPLKLLKSTREHIITSIDANITEYKSNFILKGLFSLIIRLLLGFRLKKGFYNMTKEISKQSLLIYDNKPKE